MWGIELRRQDEVSLARQIFSAITERILTGQMGEGEELPSTRELARELGVSRNTVCEAYDMLLAEGFVVSRQGAPTRVAQGLLLAHRLSGQTQNAPPAKHGSKHEIFCDFRTGQPDLSVFPWPLWSRLLREATDGLRISQLGYGTPKGSEELCEQIAHWLLRSRGMAVNPADVFITAGSTQALHILTGLLHRPGRAFALEHPSHPAISTILAGWGVEPLWVPVDEQGADVGALAGREISAVYVTPSHQFPLGGVLPATRRAALIRMAVENDFVIIEDDYDSEFRYGGAPIGPICSMDSARVAYVGTFSKTVFPALRIGFAVLPKALHSGWKRARRYLDVQNPVLEQAALAEFLRSRRMDKHVAHMRRVYREKRDVLVAALERSFGDTVRFFGDASGLHVALQFQGALFDEAFVRRGLEAGIRVYPLSAVCAEPCPKDILLMGYGHLRAEQIKMGVAALAELLKK